MSLLAPLYVLGALAVAAPIVFHLIRRRPQGETPFSSLMFLSPTPPRLTRRSRLDDRLLLLLRAAALVLLALAFARPFLRAALALDRGDAERRRVAILVDTSASLRRDGLWEKAKALADEAISALRPGDELALMAFDRETRPVFTFAESAALDAGRREAAARARLNELAPSWRSTDLGQALVEAVGALEDVSDGSEKAGRMPREVVLVTDLQQGSRLEALGAFEWPSDVALEIKAATDEGANASLQRLDDPEAEAGGADRAVRVRVSNDLNSPRETFRLQWVGEENASVGSPVEAYAPPGESRVVRIPRPQRVATALRLEGDDRDFDNTLYVADEPKREVKVFYLGDDAADDASGLLYFLQRVFQDTPRRTVRVESAPTASAPGPALTPEVPLVIVSSNLPPEAVGDLARFAEGGGTVLCVLRSAEESGTAARLLGAEGLMVSEMKPDGDVMLGEIEFDHPMFVPFSGPQYNDFTKIRFWKYRKIEERSLGDARIVARFENGDPAVVEKVRGRGRVVLLASGWNPSDSQLARSSKFVPLMATLLDGRAGRDARPGEYRVGDRVQVQTSAESTGATVRKPDGTAVRLDAGESTFAETDLPGLYLVEGVSGSWSFAVNLDPAESKTAPLPVETLEQLGCRLASGPQDAPSESRRRQMMNAELEGRQKLWRWLIAASVGVLIAETWLAGRRRAPAGEVATP